MDLVIPLLEGSGNNYAELRYSLRSYEKYLPHDRLVLIGACPSWIDLENPNVLYATFRDDPNPKYREANIFLKMKYYFMRIMDGHEHAECIFANDDYFLQAPYDPIPFPYKGTLYECYSKRSQFDDYKTAIGNTIKILGGDALNLDVHYPMLMDKEIFIKVFGDYKDLVAQSKNKIQWTTPYGFLFKTLYGSRVASTSWSFADIKFNKAIDLLTYYNNEGLKYNFSTQDMALIEETEFIFEELYPIPSRYE